MYENVSWCIPADKILDEIKENPESFESGQQVIAEYAYDDSDSKWWISLYKNGDNLEIYLETEEDVIVSDSCDYGQATNRSLAETVNSMIETALEING